MKKFWIGFGLAVAMYVLLVILTAVCAKGDL